MTRRDSPEAIVEDYLTLADDSCVAILPHALRLAGELRVADPLTSGGRHVDEIARLTETDPDALYRLLRALASIGLLQETSQQVFGLTELGHRLRADGPDSVRRSILNPDSHVAWLRGAETLRTGRPSFDAAHGSAFFAHKNRHPAADRAFLQRMRERASRCYGRLAEAVDWSDTRTVMDIGGGDGFVLDGILRHAEHVDGVLFDREETIRLVASSGGDRRFRTVEGNFFRSVAPGADTHLMCSVLHDWTDQQAEVILGSSRAALAPDGRLLIVEMVVPDGDAWHPSKWSDIGMMVLTGGRERTVGEFEKLLSSSGYTLAGVRSIPDSDFSLLEAV